MDWISIIGGIGIGGIATSVLTQYFSANENKKERIFNKKEAAYNGLLEALFNAIRKDLKIDIRESAL